MINLFSYKFMKTVVAAVFLITAVTLCGQAKRQSTIMKTPDFAFPKTVQKDSRQELSRALAERQPEEALRAFINLTVATAEISNEEVYPLLGELDSVSRTLPAPYNALGLLLEAQVYSQIYAADSWTFNNRTVDAEMAEKNPEFWDRSLFEAKVDTLIESAFRSEEEAKRLPLSNISSIISADGASLDSYTVYDFMVYRAIELMSRLRSSDFIPFYSVSAPALSPLSLIDSLLDLHPDACPARTNAILMKVELLPEDERAAFLWDRIIEAGKNAYAVPMVVRYYTSCLTSGRPAVSGSAPLPPVNPKEFYEYVESLSKAVKETVAHRKLYSIMEAMKVENVELRFPSAVSTGVPFEVKITASNINDFHLLLLKSNGTAERSFTMAELTAAMKPTASRHVILEGDRPFTADTTATLTIDSPGTYTVIASHTGNIGGLIHEGSHYYPTFFEASDIDVLSFSSESGQKGAKSSGEHGCFVVESSDGTPLEGVEVEFEEQRDYYNRNNARKKETVRTDSEGFAATTIPNAVATATFKGSKAQGRTHRFAEETERNDTTIRILTDRAVYRPGDTVKFLGILYRTDSSQGSLLCNRKTLVALNDANWQQVDSLILTSDASGRVFGEFRLPTDGLLGTWRIQGINGSARFEVAEYKVPSFLITLDKAPSSPDSVCFEGKVLTYSGMPLADIDVDFRVDYHPWFFRSSGNSKNYSSSVKTDGQGSFSISLPLANLNPKEWRGIFTIKASATDAAGETVESDSRTFFLSNAYSISPSFGSLVLVDSDSLRLDVKVNDMQGLPVTKQLKFVMKDAEDKTVEEGSFESPQLKLATALLPSGRYTFEFTLTENGDTTRCNHEVIFYRADDAVPPVESVIWLPETRIIVPAGEAKARVRFGSSFEGQCLLVVESSSKGSSTTRWIKSDGKNSYVEVEAPEKDERKFVTISGYRGHNYYSKSVTFIPAVQVENLKIEMESFRSTLEAGQKEEWKFRLVKGVEDVRGYAYALFYDKAMDAISPLSWNTSLFSPSYTDRVWLYGSGSHEMLDRFSGPSVSRPYIVTLVPDFETYDRPLFQNIRIYNMRKLASPAGASKKMNACVLQECMIMEDAEDSAVVTESRADYAASVFGASDTGATEEGISENEEKDFRPVELPVAFFMPDLDTEEDGSISIGFTVPDFNTTWNFLMGAYTTELSGSSLRLEATASKPVMVKMLPPRFLRTGDRAVITASVYNNSADETLIGGEFEIFDPISMEILERVTFDKMPMAPSGSKVVSVEYRCPADRNTLGLRVYARSGSHTDGEQTVIPVLPSSQPVVESEPFYLGAGQQTFSIALPEFKEGATVTFKYCDNPLWEAVTALPAMVEPGSESLTSLICAFYSNCVGSGLMEKYPALRKGLGMIVEGEGGDSLLVSHLEKDENLKTVTLNNTPWVRDAQSETLRLSRLGSLLDREEALASITAIWQKIVKLRNPDGGWSWCEGMRSSRWMTEALLINIGLLRTAGYLPELEDVDALVAEAAKFVDGEYADTYYKAGKDKTCVLEPMQNWLFIRSIFPGLESSFSMKNIRKEALDYLENNWERMSVFGKATTAITLWRDGRRMTAREILESLRQFASSNPVKGVWFDNLDSDWNGAGKLLTTARVLTAYHEIQPTDSIIDGLRQWMLLQKQTQDWQEGLWSIDAIDALLTSGSAWDGEYESPEITIGAKKISVDAVAALTGEVTADVGVTEINAGARVEILRHSPTPAWGGVISQYVAPMDEVKEALCTDLSISKEFWKIEETSEGVKAVRADEVHVGDKIRVSLIIDCGRDMDFVALTDARPACLEPSAQLSGYAVTDGLWCYRETRNSATNLFFDFLPRGRHIVSYDCRVMEEGDYASGIATLQCLYSPLLTAHSAGQTVTSSGPTDSSSR